MCRLIGDRRCRFVMRNAAQMREQLIDIVGVKRWNGRELATADRDVRQVEGCALREIEAEGRPVSEPVLGLELAGERGADHLGYRGSVVDRLAVRHLTVVHVGEAKA